MTISAKCIEASVSSVTGVEIYTMELRYPRFIHAEVMTHRVFSRNASSSRAIPVKRLIADVKRDTAMPIHWGANQPGMQARHALSTNKRGLAKFLWLRARDAACFAAGLMNKLGAHKQIVNRLIEPFSHINVVVTATDWDNFFDLRDHPDAQPEIRALAQAIREAMNTDIRTLAPGEWHLPYVTELERTMLLTDAAKQVSAARCARVSYKTHDGKTPLLSEDIMLYERLVGGKPIHASPTEHQATPLTMDELIDPKTPQSNFTGWFQHRKEIE